MKAVVIKEHGGTDRLELTEVADPQPRPGFAIVRVRAVALNHLDVWVGRSVPGHKFPLPIITGAEAAGTIEQLEANDSGWAAGDEVIVAPGFSCGHCVACLSGNDPLCLRFGIFGETTNGGAAQRM